MTDREKIKELEKRLAVYEADESALFYESLAKAVSHIREKLDNKTLNLDTDPFASSVIIIADKSEKIFKGLQSGKDSFIKKEDRPIEGRGAKSKTVAI